MKFHKFWSIRENQKGFTLIEVIAALAITSLIGVGVAMATVQIINQGVRNSDYTTASRYTMNAIYWISRDAQMAQTIELEGASGFPVTLSWTEWDNSEYEVTYSIEDGKLRRSYSIDGGVPKQTVVAQYINSVSENTTCEFSGGVLAITVTVTTSVAEGSHAVSVTKVREITSRPGL